MKHRPRLPIIGVTTNPNHVLDPGIVRTGLRARLYPGEDPKDLPGAESVAPAYLYLLGPDSRGITGQAL